MDGELDDSQRLLREMQTEAESDLQVPLSYRQQLNAQMKDFRSQVDQIRVQTSKIKSDDLSRRDGGYNGNSSFNSDLDVSVGRTFSPAGGGGFNWSVSRATQCERRMFFCEGSEILIPFPTFSLLELRPLLMIVVPR